VSSDPPLAAAPAAPPPDADARPRRRLVRALPVALATLAAFVVLYLIALGQGDKPFYYDSGGYFSLADAFVDAKGHFSLLHFSDPLRGYLLPLLLHGVRSINYHYASFSNNELAKLVNAATFAAIGMVLAPAFAQVVFPQRRWGLVRRVALTGVLAIAWTGYLTFPLSDFPALATALCALLAMTRAPAWWAAASTGALVAAAIEMRPAYLMLAPAVLVLFALQWRQARRTGDGPQTWRFGLGLALMAVSFVLVVLPQSLSAHKYHHTWSFLPGASLHLGSYQLTEGTRMQRYETLVSPDAFGGLVYQYAPGGRIVYDRTDRKIESGGAYAGIVLTHPHVFADLYVRHLINGFDQRYTTPYPYFRKIGSDGLPIRVLGLALAFLALLRLAWPQARRRLGPARARYAVALASTVVTSIPSAMETRFLLPLWLLAAILVLGAGWPNPLRSDAASGVARLRTPAALLAGAVVFAALAWAVATNTSEHLQLPPPYQQPKIEFRTG
jgi:hypothetical protein